MTFGVGDGGRIEDLNEIQRIVELYKQYGNELDTARMYCDGNTEEVLGQLDVHAEFKVATKVFPFKPGDHEPERLKNQFQLSLDALGVEFVDILYLHAPDYTVPFEITLKAIDELYSEKRFKEFGLSNYSAWQVMEIYKMCETNGYVKPSVYQGRYNIISRDVELELLPCLRKLNIRFYAYNPLSGGLLAATLRMDSAPQSGRFQPTSSQGQKYRERFWKEKYFKTLETYSLLCKEFNLDPVEVALRWLNHHSELVHASDNGIIIGASSYQQASTNLEFLTRPPLPDLLVQELELLWGQLMAFAPTYFR
jgi:aflatoxin B1 aldehyde reductase